MTCGHVYLAGKTTMLSELLVLNYREYELEYSSGYGSVSSTPGLLVAHLIHGA